MAKVKLSHVVESGGEPLFIGVAEFLKAVIDCGEPVRDLGDLLSCQVLAGDDTFQHTDVLA
jgi:hypothetical protein